MADDVDKTCYVGGCSGVPKPIWSAGVCHIECPACDREAGFGWSEVDAWDEWNRNRHDDKVRDTIATLRADLAKAVEGSFQSRVEPWFRECFPPSVCDDRLERTDRFIEEALELVQSGGYSPERAHALVDYVFGRPVGEPSQEVGGVQVTLAAYCIAHDLNMHEAGEAELERINRPEIIEKIRAKQAAKPTGSALPIAQSLIKELQ